MVQGKFVNNFFWGCKKLHYMIPRFLEDALIVLFCDGDVMLVSCLEIISWSHDQ